MSWYVGHDGRQVWVNSRENVFTCDQPEGDLPLSTLTYLASGSQKTTSYAEHAIDEDDGKKGKKKEKQAGKQRGFIVRVDRDETINVMPPFQAAVEKLMKSGVVSRVDLEESEGKKRNKKGKEVKEEVQEEVVTIPLGPNECRVEIAARCQHQAHGVGFTVSVAEGGGSQRIHLYTANKELSVADWHSCLVEALQADGSRCMMGRMSPAIAPPEPPDEKEIQTKKSVREEEDWLASLMGGCMVSDRKEKEAGYAEAGADAAGGAESSQATKPKAEPLEQKELPPWLRTRRSKAKDTVS
eukprot:TRINITY_DN91946_c0_g1_i1.p1 TRINITY_DN91946_c0_g1~~TRINITY_DN91946_c0_g1_i1.p1  ORF type:complete len:298 (+),score=90.34 TRINITY_DN91946_c0_g1_i1:152-1045(+)